MSKGCDAPALYHILMCKYICNSNIWYERSAKGAFDTLIILGKFAYFGERWYTYEGIPGTSFQKMVRPCLPELFIEELGTLLGKEAGLERYCCGHSCGNREKLFFI